MQPEILNQLKNLYRDGFPKDSASDIERFFSRVKEENAVYVGGVTQGGGKLCVTQSFPPPCVNAVNKPDPVTARPIVSAGYIEEKPAMLWGKRVILPYLSALSTKTEFRGKGKIGEVISGLLSRLYKRGAPVCVLYPFDHEYYKRHGFCNVSFHAEKVVKGGKAFEENEWPVASGQCINELGMRNEELGMRDVDDEKDMGQCTQSKVHHSSLLILNSSLFKTLARIYSAFTRPFDNRLIFKEKEITEKIGDYAADGIPLAVYSDKGKPFAYCFKKDCRIFYYAASNMKKFAACEALKGFAYLDFRASSKPYIQARIVNAEAALRAAPYMRESIETAIMRRGRPIGRPAIVLRVTDPLIAQNNRTFAITQEDGGVSVQETGMSPALTLTIAELTELLLLGDGKLIQKQKNIFTDQY